MNQKQILLTALLFTTVFSFAQNKGEPLITDRPDQTESAAIVPVKSVQWESGFVYEHDDNGMMETDYFSYNSSLFRIGVLKNLEMRLGIAFDEVQYKYASKEKNSIKGISPINIGTKIKIAEEKGIFPEAAFLGYLSIPRTGSDDFRHDYIIPGFKLAFSHTLNNTFSFAYNIGADWNGETPNANVYLSAVLGAGIGEKLGVFAEVYSFIDEKELPDYRWDAGLTFLILPYLQYDISGGLGINDYAPDYFISTGFSLRLPN